jgi:poly(3-hydroxybutyrate) depolymerase
MHPRSHGAQLAVDTRNDHADGQGPVANGPITLTVSYAGVQREVALFVPSRYVAGAATPLVVALHGGSGDASVMYAEDKRIVAHAERDGFIAVFPNGLPMPDKPDSTNYYWGDPVNLSYMALLLDELQACYSVDASRIYFIGFSGGAKLIYELASDPLLSSRIAGIGTVAGEIGGKPLVPATAPWEVRDPSVTGGRAVSAYLVQGAKDTHLPLAGGFDDDGEKVVVGFETKVAIWRHFTGARDETPYPAAPLPPGPAARAWTNAHTGCVVVAVVDDRLAHRWPEWDLMGAFWSFFQHLRGRAAPTDA